MHSSIPKEHETMLGVKRSTAAADLEKKGKGQGGSKKGTDGEAKSSSPARGGKRKRA